MVWTVRTRAALTLAALIAMLVAVASCGSILPGGSGASMSGTSTLAAIRLENGLSPLVPDSRLEKAALQQAGYMARAGGMEHTNGRGTDFASRMADNGIAGPAAENIARGRFDTAKVFTVWKNSPPHRRNMLDPRMNRFGLAYVRDAKTREIRYWSLVLAK